MGEERSAKISHLAVTVVNGVAALPAPTVAPSAALLTEFAKWQGGIYTSDAATISIDSNGADTVTGGLVHAWDLADSVWRTIAALNRGAVVNLTGVIGFEQIFNDIGIFGAVTISGATGGALKIVKVTPVSQRE